jgi:hypothetical protein
VVLLLLLLLSLLSDVLWSLFWWLLWFSSWLLVAQSLIGNLTKLILYLFVFNNVAKLVNNRICNILGIEADEHLMARLVQKCLYVFHKTMKNQEEGPHRFNTITSADIGVLFESKSA